MLSTLATMTSPGFLVTLDIALRGGAIALFLVIALATLRQGRGRPAAWLGALLAVGAAAYAVCSSPGPHGDPPLWFAPMLVLCTGNAAVFWLFARALFDDSFRLRPWHALVWLGLVVWPVAHLFGAGFTTHWLVGVAVRVAVILLALLALVQTVRGWGSDLVEGRRRLRLFILIAVALHIAVTVTVELVFGHDHVPIGLHLLNSAALAAIAAIIAVLLLQADLDSVLPAPVLAEAVAPGVAPTEDEPVDPGLLATLERLMAVDRLYRQEGLTIGVLAGKLGLPEYRLRRAINRGLGYRNFNEYLNRHRLADAKQALADPTQAEVPILTIALDSGFQSLGPFNRAFKTDTGITPTEYRRTATGRNGA
ncbi:helix-turn-helix domain-containing protein [Reyranella sp.]|uniref:AraC family transcriptional regulator n=1 Tax=Reyranella sp. TaxID=1929291 RepID=UPI002731B4C9|nr:helix-turn-helix domain-containing protein [Reyranella sp.]MDP2375218.1 helix-turn-helix domain-containing protein [Reyranella sp.]